MRRYVAHALLQFSSGRRLMDGHFRDDGLAILRSASGLAVGVGGAGIRAVLLGGAELHLSGPIDGSEHGRAAWIQAPDCINVRQCRPKLLVVCPWTWAAAPHLSA